MSMLKDVIGTNPLLSKALTPFEVVGIDPTLHQYLYLPETAPELSLTVPGPLSPSNMVDELPAESK